MDECICQSNMSDLFEVYGGMNNYWNSYSPGVVGYSFQDYVLHVVAIIGEHGFCKANAIHLLLGIAFLQACPGIFSQLDINKN